jgi:hypothetical protein
MKVLDNTLSKSAKIKFGAVAVMGRTLTIMALLTFCVAMAGATDYYVSPSGSDSNPGSSAKPFKTIQKAGGLATAGSTVHVLPGTYTTTSTISTKASGNSNAHIRFVSTVQWGAKIVSTMGMPSTTWQNSGNYVDIVGFDITGGGNEGILNLASHVTIIGNHVHNLPATFCNLASPTGAGINSGANYTAGDNDVIGNVVHDIGIPGKCSVGQGIYHANARGHVYNNISYNNGAYGICLWHAATENTISSNVLFGNGLGGIWLGANYESVSNNLSVVSNNIIYKNKGYAIREEGSVGSSNQYLNNIIFSNPSGVVLINGSAVGTITSDPQFVNPTGSYLTGNYQVKSTSPAINKGTNVGAPVIDFNGAQRPYGGGWDIGAYQMGATAPAWPYEQ